MAVPAALADAVGDLAEGAMDAIGGAVQPVADAASELTEAETVSAPGKESHRRTVRRPSN